MDDGELAPTVLSSAGAELTPVLMLASGEFVVALLPLDRCPPRDLRDPATPGRGARGGSTTVRGAATGSLFSICSRSSSRMRLWSLPTTFACSPAAASSREIVSCASLSASVSSDESRRSGLGISEVT